MLRAAERLKGAVRPFSQLYWETRYALGGTSGPGSYGELARFKARALNALVERHRIQSVIEFGCGDGAQLERAAYPRYVGLDVSRRAVRMCKKRFAQDATKSFFLYDPTCFADRHGLFRAELVLSLDVVYHLIEEETFRLYMTHLFASAERFVAIYSSNAPTPTRALHVRHRRFTDWVDAHANGWRLVETVANDHVPRRRFRAGVPYDLFVYAKNPEAVALGEAPRPFKADALR